MYSKLDRIGLLFEENYCINLNFSFSTICGFVLIFTQQNQISTPCCHMSVSLWYAKTMNKFEITGLPEINESANQFSLSRSKHPCYHLSTTRHTDLSQHMSTTSLKSLFDKYNKVSISRKRSTSFHY